MTVEDISERQRKSNVEHDAARRIRTLLDEAREAYGAEQWDDDGIEQAVLDLVTD